MMRVDLMDKYMLKEKGREPIIVDLIHNGLRRHHLLRTIYKVAKRGYGGLIINKDEVNMSDLYELFEKGYEVQLIKNNQVRIRWYGHG